MDGSIDERDDDRIPKRTLFAFFEQFRDYLTEYYRESVFELSISEIPVVGTLQLFDGLSQGKVKIKNQGHVVCYLSTSRGGGYRLDSGESVEFFVNSPVMVTTLSGAIGNLGFIKT